jgi:hypothetical protein
VSCGLDDGKFYLFDARDKITSAAFYIDTRTEDLFTHERYNDFMVLLGYGDGEIKHIDMRQARTVSVTDLVSFDAPVHLTHSSHSRFAAAIPSFLSCSLCTVQDPFVEAIGGIEFNAESEAFVVSGYTEYVFAAGLSRHIFELCMQRLICLWYPCLCVPLVTCVIPVSSVASPSGRSRARRRWCTATARTILSLSVAWATPALPFSTTPRQCCYPITRALSASSFRIPSDAPSNPSFCATIELHCSQWPSKSPHLRQL